jgi:hypothetical protein
MKMSRARSEEFAAFDSSAELAVSRLGRRATRVLLAGLPVAVDFAGDRLHDLMTPAFGHVMSGEHLPPSLHVTVWDSATSGVPLPREVQPVWDHMPRSLGRLTVEDGIIAFYDADAAGLSYLDFARRRGLLWIEDAGSLAERHRAAPLQTILTWFLPRHGRSVVHAAAVATDAGAVILCGASGAGKSTTALSCLAAGFHYLSDDLCAVTFEDDVAVHSLYCTAKLHEHHLPEFPDFAEITSNRERLATEKAIAYLASGSSARLRGSVPLRAAVVLAAKVDGSPRLRPIARAAALRAIAPNTLHAFPGFGREGFSSQAAVLSRLPCFEMDLSREMGANPECLRTLIEQANAAPEVVFGRAS